MNTQMIRRDVSLEVLPGSTQTDVVYSRLGQAVDVLQGDTRYPRRCTTYLYNLIFGELSLTASLHVDCVRDRLKVGGVDASRIPAQVIKFHSVRDGPHHLYVRSAVRPATSRVQRDGPVSERVCSAVPVPASSIGVHRVSIRRDPCLNLFQGTAMTKDESKRMPLAPSETSFRARRDRRRITTAALTKTIGDVWGTMTLHSMVLSSGVMTSAVTAARGLSVSSLYPKTPNESGKRRI